MFSWSKACGVDLLMFVVLVSTVPKLPLAMVDVNSRELQYIADHLTDHKCSQLLDALHQSTFQLPSDDKSLSEPVHPNPCVSRLEEWSNGPGKNNTVEYLALRLTEIGLPKLSKKVSGLVMKETSEELHRFFLDDPFKDMIPSKSAMVDETDDDDADADQTEDDTSLDEEEKGQGDEDDQLFTAVVILMTVSLTLFVSISICLVCPQAGQFVCQNACPQLCASCYDVTVDGCQRAWYGTKNNINRYMLVTPKGAGNGAALAI